MQLENICLFLGPFLPALRLTHDAWCRLTPYPQTLCAIPWGCSFGVIFLLKDVLNILKCAVITASGPVLGGRSAAPLATSVNFLVSFLGISGYWGKKSWSLYFSPHISITERPKKCQSWWEGGGRNAGRMEWSVPLQRQLIVTACPVMQCPHVLKCRTGDKFFPDDVLKSITRLCSCHPCYISG